MRITIIIMMLIVCVSLVNGFKVDTMSYSVKSTNIGLAGSDLDTYNYTGRFYFEPFYPGSIGETGFYWLHAGYFEEVFGFSFEIFIIPIFPVNNDFFSGNTSFNYSIITNGTITSCNLLVYQNNTLLTINDSDTAPINYSFGPYTLPESMYTWNVECSNYLGNISSSPLYTFTIDNTPPLATIITPLNNVTPYNNFTINIIENNPGYLIISVNGTDYYYNYTSGINIFTPNLLLGYVNYNVTVYDLANNSQIYGPFNIYVNNNPVNISNIMFDPATPLMDVYNTISATITGTFSNVTVSIYTNSSGWFNRSVYLNSGSRYYYIVDGSLLQYGETISQQWHVLDSTNVWRHSNVYSAIISKDFGTDRGPNETITPVVISSDLIINPNPIQINNLNGQIFTIYNNNSNIVCELINVRVQDTIGSKSLQDKFIVKTIDTLNLSIAPKSSISLQIKPTGIKGIVGNGYIITETKNCGTSTSNLSVQIYFTDIIIDTINKFTSDIINWFNMLLE